MKFHNKSKEEKDEFLKNVKEICVYNQEHFLSFSKNHKYEQSKMINFLLQNQNTLKQVHSLDNLMILYNLY
jgi:hypothetical protein